MRLVPGLLAAVFPLLVSGIASPTPAGPVATVGDRGITWAEVDAASRGKISALRRELLAAKRAALRTLIEDKLVERAAREAGLSREGFYDREVASKAGQANKRAVEEFYRKHRRDFAGEPARDKDAVRFYLEREARKKQRKILLAGLSRRFGVKRQEVSDEQLGGQDPGLELATVGGEPVTYAMVENKAKLRLYRLRGEIAREALRQVEQLVRAELLSVAARRDGLTVAALQERLKGSVAKVTEADIDRYYREKMLAENPAAEKHPERIRAYLEFIAAKEAEERLVRRMQEAVPVKVTIREPEPVRLAVPEAPWAPAKGPADASVSLTVFYNYHCRYCREMLRIYSRLEKGFGTQARLSLRHFLPVYDPVADELARGAVCAGRRNRFWEYNRKVLQPAKPPSRALDVARKLGIADDDFKQCLLSPETARIVDRDTEVGRSLGLEDAPAILINGRVFGGRQAIDRLESAVQREIGTDFKTGSGRNGGFSAATAPASTKRPRRSTLATSAIC